MEEGLVSLVISILALIISLISFFGSRKKSESSAAFNFVPLQLQAYERLVMLCERIALPNLISRVNQPELSAKEMQVLLNEHIKQEFEYNTSQQVYVSQAAWNAVRNLKDQNMLEINQLANVLPPDAKASELNKQLLSVIVQQNEKPLHLLVLETLNSEAKKLIK